MLTDCRDRCFARDPTRLHAIRMIMRRTMSIIFDCSIHDLLYLRYEESKHMSYHSYPTETAFVD